MENNVQLENITRENIIKKANAMLMHIQSMEQKFQMEKLRDEQDMKKKIQRLEQEKNNAVSKIQAECDKTIIDLKIEAKNREIQTIKSCAHIQDKQQKIGISLIQAFFGTDPLRIQATIRQLIKTLSQKTIPEEFIFVEAQTSNAKASFRWLKDKGVKYIFVKYNKESDGLLLKTALWNIGVKACTLENLCFVDSDVVFEDDDWAQKVYDAFQKYDVMSLSKQARYEEELDGWRNTIGFCATQGNLVGHVGFTLGMKRSAYERYGGFEAFALHDDMWLWHRIFGFRKYKMHPGWTPYNFCAGMENGLPFNVGYADTRVIHLYHGQNDREKYELFGYVEELANENPFDDITYDAANPEILPVWSDTRTGKIVKKAFEYIRSAADIPPYVQEKQAKQLAIAFIEQAAQELIGQAQSPIIMTAYREDYVNRGIKPVIDFKAAVEEKCRQNVTFIVITDAVSTEDAAQHGIDAVPFSSKKILENTKLWPAERFSPIIEFPADSAVFWLDFGNIPKRNFIIMKDGTAYIE